MNEAELLFTEILKCNRPYLYLNKELHLDKEKSIFISLVLRRRITGEPLPYILGKTEFMGLEFKVTPDVFIPRPETEILVETVIKLVLGDRCLVLGTNILDLGTGSGCISVSLAKFLPNTNITATDISKAALDIAEENARSNKVENRIRFTQGDLFNTYNLTPKTKHPRLNTYNIIVSNPPYISTVEIEDLPPEVRYEPRVAIYGGGDGLDFYRCIIRESVPYLKKGGLLILEIGFEQKDALKNIFQKSSNFEIIDIVKDYNKIDRIIVAKKWIN